MEKITGLKKGTALFETAIIALGLAACSKKNIDTISLPEESSIETTFNIDENTSDIVDIRELSYEEEYDMFFNDVLKKYPGLIGHVSYEFDGMDETLKIEGVTDCDELSLFVQELNDHFLFSKLVIDAQSFDGLAFDKSYVKELDIYSNDGLYKKAFNIRSFTSLKKLTLNDVEVKNLPIVIEDISMTTTDDSYDYVQGFRSIVSYDDFTAEEKESGLCFSDKVSVKLDGMRLQDFWSVSNDFTLTLDNCYGNSNMNLYGDNITINNNSKDSYINITSGVVGESLTINDQYNNISNIGNIDLGKDASLIYNTESNRGL